METLSLLKLSHIRTMAMLAGVVALLISDFKSLVELLLEIVLRFGLKPHLLMMLLPAFQLVKSNLLYYQESKQMLILVSFSVLAQFLLLLLWMIRVHFMSIIQFRQQMRLWFRRFLIKVLPLDLQLIPNKLDNLLILCLLITVLLLWQEILLKKLGFRHLTKTELKDGWEYWWTTVTLLIIQLIKSNSLAMQLVPFLLVWVVCIILTTVD